MLEATEKWKEVVKKQLVSEMTRFETQIKATYANASPEEKEKLRAEAEKTKALHLLSPALLTSCAGGPSPAVTKAQIATPHELPQIKALTALSL